MDSPCAASKTEAIKQLLALLLFVPSLCLAQSVTLPYNPDVNADSAITSTDLLGLLPIFGGFFTPEEVLIDGTAIALPKAQPLQAD